MPRRKLTAAEANRALGMIQAGLKQNEVSRIFHVSESVIHRLRLRFEETGTVSERPRAGRPRKTNNAQDRFIALVARREPLSTSKDLKMRIRNAHGIEISCDTIRRRLHNANLRSRRLLRRVPLNREDMRARLEWARMRVNWREEWRSVLFTDESRFGRYPDSRRVRVWTSPRVPRNRRSVQLVYPFRGGTVMVWGGICYNGRSELHICQQNMNGEEYRRHVIGNVLPQFQAAIGEHFIFLDDNARPHRAAAVLQAIEEQGIQHLRLPARSPDLNCIEHAWDMLQRRLDEYIPRPNTFNELLQILTFYLIP